MSESTERRYNGWTNYETWNVALWIDNEQGSYRQWRDNAEEQYRDAVSTEYSTRAEVAARSLAQQLKDEIEESAPDLGASMWSDLLGAALSEVNWDEIAGNWIDEVKGEIDKEEKEAEDDSTYADE